MAGLIIFILIVIAVIVIPPMLGYSVNDYDLSNPNLAPGGEHLLGTDKQGRDCLFRLFLGGRISIYGWYYCCCYHCHLRMYNWRYFWILWWKIG